MAGQAYVAASRAGVPSENRISIELQEGGSIYITPIIVYKEVFSRKL
jgi:hypothetical protein